MTPGDFNQKPFSLLESILWTPEDGFFLLDDHLARLARSAAYFGYPCSRPVILDHLHQLAASLSQPSKIRLTVDRQGQPTVEALSLVLDPRPVRVALARAPIDPADPFLAHKTTRRRVYDQALASRPDADDVMLWNPAGEITEATIANVVVQLQNRLVTPPLSCGLLPGVFRAHLLARDQIHERVITLDEFTQAEKVWLINSVRRWRQCAHIPHALPED